MKQARLYPELPLETAGDAPTDWILVDADRCLREISGFMRVGRGDSVAVFGCGGVGDAAIEGARIAGASTIIAVDIDAAKLEWAKGFGATHTIDSSQTDPVEAIREITGGNGVDVAIEAVGLPVTYEQAFYARDLAGTVVLVGVPDPEMKIELPLIEGRRVRTTGLEEHMAPPGRRSPGRRG